MQLGRIIDTTLRVSIRYTNMLSGVQAAPYSEHKRIYDAIAQGKPDKAKKESEKLVGGALDLINEALQGKR